MKNIDEVLEGRRYDCLVVKAIKDIIKSGLTTHETLMRFIANDTRNAHG